MTSEISSNNHFKEAGAAGAGGGTLLMLISKNLPDDNPLKTVIMLLIPSISIAISAIWIWIKPKLENHLIERKLKVIITRAKQTLSDSLDNPNTSEEHRKQLRTELEQLEMLLVHSDIESIKALMKKKE